MTAPNTAVGRPSPHDHRPQRHRRPEDEPEHDERQRHLPVGVAIDHQRRDAPSPRARRRAARWPDAAREHGQEEAPRQREQPRDARPERHGGEREAELLEARDPMHDHRLDGAVAQHAGDREEQQPRPPERARGRAPTCGAPSPRGTRGRGRGVVRTKASATGAAHASAGREHARGVAPPSSSTSAPVAGMKIGPDSPGGERERGDRLRARLRREGLLDGDVGGLVERQRASPGRARATRAPAPAKPAWPTEKPTSPAAPTSAPTAMRPRTPWRSASRPTGIAASPPVSTAPP